MAHQGKRLAALARLFAALWAGAILAGCSSLATADWPPRAHNPALDVPAGPGGAALSGLQPSPWGGRGWTPAGPSSAGPDGVGGANLVSASSAPIPGVGGGLAGRPTYPSLNLPMGASALLAPPAVVRTTPRLQCVPFAREASGIEIYGNANTWWRQAEGRFLRTTGPAVGAVMAMRGYRNANRGHVAVVTAIKSDREILVDHANWLNRGEVSVNTPVLDVSEAGDWSQVRVWHIPSGKWGARIYSVQGFIHQG
jgi:hypothetical protein